MGAFANSFLNTFGAVLLDLAKLFNPSNHKTGKYLR
jgi:hypothetical protein